MQDTEKDPLWKVTDGASIRECALATVCTLGVLALAVYLTRVFAGTWWGVASSLAVLVGLSWPEAVLKRRSQRTVIAAFTIVCSVAIAGLFYLVAARMLQAWVLGAVASFFICGVAILVGIWASRYATAQIRMFPGEDRTSGKVRIAQLAYRLTYAVLLASMVGTLI